MLNFHLKGIHTLVNGASCLGLNEKCFPSLSFKYLLQLDLFGPKWKVNNLSNMLVRLI